ncbi:hypothetical protein [Herbaspirillum huttiense]|uniref:hypothetical protein n=1 Tax=Herbaspirillum huttiense TaxID=863372 RepID=UPI002176D5D9|nr:hypothetical protein [Herbaspirillum huttiense]UWE19017.1 hypothetical protein NY669_12805 [Herbaspirillum huttiense]
MKHFSRIGSIFFLSGAIAWQAYVLFLVFLELFYMHRLGFASGLGYGGVFPFSISFFFLGILLSYFSKEKFVMYVMASIYIGSHFLIWILVFFFGAKGL